MAVKKKSVKKKAAPKTTEDVAKLREEIKVLKEERKICDDIACDLTLEIVDLKEENKKLSIDNAKLTKWFEIAKANKLGGASASIPVPNLQNKARVIKACRGIIDDPACENVKDLITGIRDFIEDHCK